MKLDVNLDFIKKSNLSWLHNNLLFVTLHGSHAYGTNTPTSDIDLRGIVIKPKQYYFGNLNSFEQAQFKDPYDCVLFDLNKFVKLASDANPNALEIIFTEESDHLFVSKIGEELLSIRDNFLSKKCRYTLSGYAHSQLRRINVHRRWLLHPITNKPERKDFGLPENHKLIPEHQLLEIEATIRNILDDWKPDTTGMENDVAIKFNNELYDILLDLKISHDDMDLYAAKYLGLNDNLIEAFKQERKYKLALREYKQYQEWKKNRNPVRADLEAKYGIDWKHGMHLVRLFKCCEEVLRYGKLNIKRQDAQELLEIRNGSWTFDQLIEWSENKEKEINALYQTSTLPKEPNRKFIDQWLVSTIDKFLGVI